MAVTVMEMVGKLVGDTTDFERSMAGAERSMGVTAKRIRVGAGIAATAITGGLVVAAKVGWDQFQSGQLVAAQTEAVLKSTGDAANVTASHIKDLGVALMNKSGIDDQVIRSGENVLATFQDVRNEAGKGRDIFDQATRAALDLSVATGRDLTSANKTVGRALNDPIKGLASLTRLGIKFTDQEKAQMQTMVDHNNIIGAQQVILAKLNTAYGGSADISGTVAGKMAIAREQFKNTAETLVGALLPAFEAILGPLATMAGFLGRHTTLTKALVVALAGLATALYAVSAAARIAAAAQVLFALSGSLGVVIALVPAVRSLRDAWILLDLAMAENPVGIVIVALAALAVGLVVAWKRSQTFRAVVAGAFHTVQAVAGAAVGFIRDHWMALLAVITGPIGPAIALVIQHFGSLRAAVSSAINAARAVIRTLGSAFAPVIGSIRTVIGWIRSLVGAIRAVPDISFNVIPNLPSGGLLHNLHVPGFASGGIVPGPIDAPRLIVAHGGETVLTRQQSSSAGVVNVYLTNHGVLGSETEVLNWLQSATRRYERRNGRSPF